MELVRGAVRKNFRHPQPEARSPDRTITPKRRQRLGVERVWDGRGDALTDARLTISAGRLADDLRCGVTHLRIMAHVGRQNGQRGWLRVSQSELAERWACHRNTVNRAFADLVAWGYLRQRTQSESGESFCLYSVALDRDDDSVEEPPGDRKADAGCTMVSAPHAERGALSGVHQCTPHADTSAQPPCAPPHYRHARAPTVADKRRKKPTPTPPVAVGPMGEGAVGRAVVVVNARGWTRAWDLAARNAVFDLIGSPDRHHVAANLLVPLVGTLNPPAGVHGASYVRDVADQLGRWPAHVLGTVAEQCRVERVRDLPSVAALARTARTIAHRLAAGVAAEPNAAQGLSVDAWLAAVTAGNAADPAVALTRRLVGRIGAAATMAWFDGMVVTVDGDRATIAIQNDFKRRWVNQRYESDLELAARAEWPRATVRTAAPVATVDA